MAQFHLETLLPLLPREQALKEAYRAAELPGDPFGTPEEIQLHWYEFNRRIADRMPHQAAGYLLNPEELPAPLMRVTYEKMVQILFPGEAVGGIHFYRQDRYLPGTWHTHDFYELVLVLSGSCAHNIAGDRYRFTAGDLALIPPNTPHNIQVLDDDALQYNLGIRSDFLQINCRSILTAHHPLGEFLTRNISGQASNSYLIFKAADYLAGDNLLAALLEENDSDRPYKGTMLEALTLALLADLMRHCAPSTVTLSMQETSPESEILLYIRNHFQTITMEELEARFHYSRRQLQRILSREASMTLTQMLGQLRMEYVREQLQATDVPVAQIIDQAGFTDPSHFYRDFKKQFGVSPQAYRDGGTGSRQ